jgi:hypothetical protein
MRPKTARPRCAAPDKARGGAKPLREKAAQAQQTRDTLVTIAYLCAAKGGERPDWAKGRLI